MMSIGTKGFRVLALAALLATPAAAQMPNINMMPELKSKTPEEKERDEKVEKAYRDSLRKIPDAKTGSDPWGDVRGSAPAKPTAKPSAAPKNAKASGIAKSPAN